MKLRYNRSGESQLSVFMGKVEDGFVAVTRKAAQAALEEAVLTTPQFSGDMASNWRFSVGEPKPGHKSTPYKDRLSRKRALRSEGDRRALKEANAGSKIAFQFMSAGDRFYISTWGVHENRADGATWLDAYAGAVERGEIKFRNENPSKGHILKRAGLRFRLKFRALKLMQEWKKVRGM